MAEPFAQVPLAIIRDRRLTKRQRPILEALISFRGRRQGHVFPSLDEIAARCDIDRTTVSRVLNQLARGGYIRIKRNRRGVSDYYFLFAFHDWSPDQELPSDANSKPDQELTPSVNKSCRPASTRVDAQRQPPTDQLSDQDQRERAPTPKAGKKKSMKPLAFERLPDSWRDHLAAAYPSIDLEVAFRKFRLHAIETDRRAADWRSAFERWCINEHPAPRDTRSPARRRHIREFLDPPRTAAERGEAYAAEVRAAIEANGGYTPEDR